MDYYKNLSLENLTCYDKDGNYHVEEWKDISDYIGIYQSSTFGRVKGLERVSSQSHLLKEKILKQHINSNGYLYVNLYKNGKTKTKTIHRLVALTFIPNPLNREKVNHIDLIKTNCYKWNLEWETPRGNAIHYCSTINSSSEYIGVHWHKLTGKWVAEIHYNKKNYHLGLYNTEIEASEAYNKALKEINEVGVITPYVNPKKASKHKGVCFHKEKNKWQAQIKHKGIYYFIGRYNTEQEAVEAYQKKIIELGL